MNHPVPMHGFALVLTTTLLCGAPAHAAIITVDCDAGQKIQDRVLTAKPRDVIRVSGTCREDVAIPSDVVSITLDGQGSATIQAVKRDAVYIRGREITVKGFTLTGGRDGVHLSGGASGASANIEGNVIRKSGRHGIHLDHTSVGRISSNTIEDVGAIGIDVNEGSVARIGYITATVGGSGNTIRNAGRHGIVVSRNSSARILANVIEGSRQHGVYVHRSSQADVVGNTISGNGGDGIHARHASGINLSVEELPGKMGPNQSAAKNAGAGIHCAMGGYVEGPLGTLDGAKSAKDFDGTCLDRVMQ